MANKAYKCRIYPNAEQQVLFAKTFGCVRFIYNTMLYDKKKFYNLTGKMLNNTPAQYKNDYPWLKEVDSLALANAQQNLETAFKSFFRDSKIGYPHFKSKKDNHLSYTTNYVNHNIYLTNGYLRLPKIGLVRIKQHRQIPDNYILKSVTISRTPTGKYYASILFEYENQVLDIEPTTFIGLDYSMHELYKDSNGDEPQYPKYYRRAEKRLCREQRKLSLMQKGSKNRDKQRIKVAKLHEKIANQRKDFLHKQSKLLADKYDCVCIEDLDMKAMSRSLHFGKSVHDNGWGMFVTFLKYKLEEQGKRLVKVDKFFASSQTCNVCGYKNTATKSLSIRAWDCPECGTHHDRDVNAAINIKNEGMRIVCA